MHALFLYANVYRDAVVVGFVNAATSIFVGATVFVVIGIMAEERGQSIDSVIKSGKRAVCLFFIFGG